MISTWWGGEPVRPRSSPNMDPAGALPGMSCQSEVSFWRNSRRTWSPQTCSWLAKRSWENGMRISAVQPSPSRRPTSQIGSQLMSVAVVEVPSLTGQRVALDPGGVDGEDEGRPVVKHAVEGDVDPVAIRIVAARHAALDPRGLVVVGLDGDVNILVVVQDLEARLLRRLRPLVGAPAQVPLGEPSLLARVRPQRDQRSRTGRRCRRARSG